MTDTGVVEMSLVEGKEAPKKRLDTMEGADMMKIEKIETEKETEREEEVVAGAMKGV